MKRVCCICVERNIYIRIYEIRFKENEVVYVNDSLCVEGI